MQELILEAMDAGACGLSISSMGTVNNHVDIDGTPMPTDVMNIEDMCKLVEVFRGRGEGLIQVIFADRPRRRQRGECQARRGVGPPNPCTTCSRPAIIRLSSTASSMAWLDNVNARGILMRRSVCGEPKLERGRFLEFARLRHIGRGCLRRTSRAHEWRRRWRRKRPWRDRKIIASASAIATTR